MKEERKKNTRSTERGSVSPESAPFNLPLSSERTLNCLIADCTERRWKKDWVLWEGEVSFVGNHCKFGRSFNKSICVTVLLYHCIVAGERSEKKTGESTVEKCRSLWLLTYVNNGKFSHTPSHLHTHIYNLHGWKRGII